MRPGAAARHPQGKELLLAAELLAVRADGPAVGILRLLEGFASSFGCILTSGSPAAVGGGSRGGAAPSKPPPRFFPWKFPIQPHPQWEQMCRQCRVGVPDPTAAVGVVGLWKP